MFAGVLQIEVFPSHYGGKLSNSFDVKGGSESRSIVQGSEENC